MKNGQKLGKFCPDLDQKFTIPTEIFLDALLLVLTNISLCFILFRTKIFWSTQILFPKRGGYKLLQNIDFTVTAKTQVSVMIFE
jgi:hypothetical protein